MMKKTIAMLLVALMAMTVASQGLPQFSSNDFEGWTYNNPGIALNSSNISLGRIVLYVNSKGKVLTLTSPEFTCQGMDSIAADVLWYTSTFYDSSFDLSRATLTMTLVDSLGQAVDSVTCVPPTLCSSRTLSLCLAVPRGLTQCRLRFVSWTGNVISSGAIKQAVITAVDATPPPAVVLVGDVDGDGIVGIADVTQLIDCLLVGIDGDEKMEAADVDQDNVITIGDITTLIDMIING